MKLKLILEASAGVLSNNGKDLINYGIRSIKDLQLVINHFDKFPLKTKKLNDYKLFKKAFELIKNKKHLTQAQEGLEILVLIKSLMNKGLTPELKIAFPNINSEALKLEAKLDSKKGCLSDSNKAHWFSGFTTGEGSFQVSILKCKTTKIGYQVLLRFSIGQHRRDENLLISLIDYLDCGTVQKKTNSKYNTDSFEFQVYKFDDIINKIIPFFVKYPIHGKKIIRFPRFL